MTLSKSIVIVLIMFCVTLAACGPDGDDTTPVSLQLVQEEQEGQGSLFLKEIPGSVVSVFIRITGRDMEPIEKTVDVTYSMRSDGYVLLELHVPNGTDRSILVEAYGVEGYPPLLCGHDHVNLTGQPTETTIIMREKNCYQL